VDPRRRGRPTDDGATAGSKWTPRGAEGRPEPYRPYRESLAPVLRAWKAKTGGKGFLFVPAPKATRKARFIDAETLGRHLRKALEGAALPRLTWYSCTRHTFASQFVMNGGSIERLRLILGHSSVMVTERYAHLNPDHFGARELSAVTVDLSRPEGKVIALDHAAITLPSKAAGGDAG